MPTYQSPADQYYALQAAGWSDADIIAQYGVNSPVGRIIATLNRWNQATPNASGYRYQYPTTPRRDRSYAQSDAPAMMTDTAPLNVMPQAAPAQDAYYQAPEQPQPMLAPTPPTPAPDPSRGLPQYASNSPMIEQAMYSPRDTVPSYTGPAAERSVTTSPYPEGSAMVEGYQLSPGIMQAITDGLNSFRDPSVYVPDWGMLPDRAVAPQYPSLPSVNWQDPSGYAPTQEAIDMVRGAQDYMVAQQQAQGTNFRDPSAYAPDFGMLPDRAVAPQYPSLPRMDWNDVSGYAPTQEVLDMIDGYQRSAIANQQARDAAVAAYTDPAAYAPSPAAISAAQSVQPTGLIDTIMSYLRR